MLKDEKILVLGASGMVGSAIVKKLLEREYENIVGTWRNKIPPVKDTRVRYFQIDLTKQQDTEEFFKKERPDYVFLASAKVGGILANYTYSADFIYQNLAIEMNVIHFSYLYKVKKLLFLGSSCIYPKLCPQPIKEEYLLSGYLEPTNEAYAIAKIAGIKMCQSYNRQFGTKFISVMPTNLYGPNDNFDLKNSHVLPALIRKFHLAKLAFEKNWEAIERDEKVFGPIPEDLKKSLGIDPKTNTPLGCEPEIILWGTGTPRREFLHVDDLADACVFLIDNYEENEIINIGVGEDLSISELASIIAKTVGFYGNIRFDPSKPDGTPRKLLDVSQLNALGWKAKISLKEGIKETYKWYLRILNSRKL